MKKELKFTFLIVLSWAILEYLSSLIIRATNLNISATLVLSVLYFTVFISTLFISLIKKNSLKEMNIIKISLFFILFQLLYQFLVNSYPFILHSKEIGGPFFIFRIMTYSFIEGLAYTYPGQIIVFSIFFVTFILGRRLTK